MSCAEYRVSLLVVPGFSTGINSGTQSLFIAQKKAGNRLQPQF